MCENCKGLEEKIKINHPYEYFNIIDQLKPIIDKGTLVLVEGTCALDKIKKDMPWPNDFFEHIFECKFCSQKFKLSVETYHGSGGSWEVI